MVVCIIADLVLNAKPRELSRPGNSIHRGRAVGKLMGVSCRHDRLLMTAWIFLQGNWSKALLGRAPTDSLSGKKSRQRTRCSRPALTATADHRMWHFKGPVPRCTSNGWYLIILRLLCLTYVVITILMSYSASSGTAIVQYTYAHYTLMCAFNRMQHLYSNLLNTRQLFVPPNPKLFVAATLTSFSCAVLGTKLKSTPTSGFSRLSVAGTMPYQD